tara:strand:+ start:565 stop:699 length:135 start_codon:yes stop_codon:yes gene_type:complete
VARSGCQRAFKRVAVRCLEADGFGMGDMFRGRDVPIGSGWLTGW